MHWLYVFSCIIFNFFFLTTAQLLQGTASTNATLCGLTWARVDTGQNNSITWKLGQETCKKWNTKGQLLCNYVGSSQSCPYCKTFKPTMNGSSYFEWADAYFWTELSPSFQRQIRPILNLSAFAFNADADGGCSVYTEFKKSNNLAVRTMKHNTGSGSLVNNGHPPSPPSPYVVCVVENSKIKSSDSSCPKAANTASASNKTGLTSSLTAVLIVICVIVFLVVVILLMNAFRGKWKKDPATPEIDDVRSASRGDEAFLDSPQITATETPDQESTPREPTQSTNQYGEISENQIQQQRPAAATLPRESTVLLNAPNSGSEYRDFSSLQISKVEEKGKPLQEFSRQNRWNSVVALIEPNPRPTMTHTQLGVELDHGSLLDLSIQRGASFSNLMYAALPHQDIGRARGASSTVEMKPDMRNRQKTISTWDKPKRLDPHKVSVGPRLAGGAFGEVFIGVYEHAWVAIKMMREMDDDTETDAEARKADIEREMKLYERLLGIKHIAQIFGYCDNPFCVVMEYYSNLDVKRLVYGRNQKLLQERFRGGPVPLEMRVRFCFEAAKGIRALHSIGIVHRDIAARNLLLDDSLTVHVSDFGMSRLMKPTGQVTLSRSGPLKWMAPESLKPRKVWNNRTDMYMFGITMWEVFHGREPYPKTSPFEAAVEVMYSEARPKVSRNTDIVPHPIKKLMERCWHTEPNERPTSFYEIVTNLGKVYNKYSAIGKDHRPLGSFHTTDTINEESRSESLHSEFHEDGYGNIHDEDIHTNSMRKNMSETVLTTAPSASELGGMYANMSAHNIKVNIT